MELTSENVENLFNLCVDDRGEEVQGIMRAVPMRAEPFKKEIGELLDQLPNTFKKDHGGGGSFLVSCENNAGVQWTGMHAVMELLLLMGLATDQIEFVLPRESWKILPGGMPYFVIK